MTIHTIPYNGKQYMAWRPDGKRLPFTVAMEAVRMALKAGGDTVVFPDKSVVRVALDAQ